jgi:hypothetical protein
MAGPNQKGKHMPQDMPNKSAPLGELHEVRATFPTSDRMQDAIGRLELSGFDRADLSLPEAAPPLERSTPESGAEPADTEDDARQARTMHSSTAAAAAAIAAAGLTIGTGGAAAPAIAAAVLAGGAIGGATSAVSSAAISGEQRDRDAKAAAGTLILSVRTPTRAMRDKAVDILRAAGGTDIVTP